MNELFENKTKYNQKEFDIFQKSYSEEYTLTNNLHLIFYVVFFIIYMIFAFINGEILIGFLLIGTLIGYLWYRVIRPNKKAIKERKKYKLNNEFSNTYRFYNNYFKVENPEGKIQLFYFKIYRVVETSSHFYIYLTREDAYIVSKIGFTKGNANDFSKFIKKKMLLKYKNRKKKDSKKNLKKSRK